MLTLLALAFSEVVDGGGCLSEYEESSPRGRQCFPHGYLGVRRDIENGGGLKLAIESAHTGGVVMTNLYLRPRQERRSAEECRNS